VQDEEFAALAGQWPDADELSRRLVDLALQRHTDDNASVVVAHVEQVGTTTAPDKTRLSAWRRVASVLQSLF
jgi:serine/threonine protein phosphatase PrpC